MGKYLLPGWKVISRYAVFAISYVIVGLIENAVFGCADWKLGITNDVMNTLIHSSILYGIPALTVSLGFLCFYLLDYHVFTQWRKQRSSSEVTGLLNEDEFVPMLEATTRAYEEARNAGSMWAYAAEAQAKRAAGAKEAENAILGYMATIISSKVRIFGLSPPSRIIEEIDLRRETGVFKNGPSEWYKVFGLHPIYTELKVRKSDLADVIDYLKNGHKTDEPI